MYKKLLTLIFLFFLSLQCMADNYKIKNINQKNVTELINGLLKVKGDCSLYDEGELIPSTEYIKINRNGEDTIVVFYYAMERCFGPGTVYMDAAELGVNYNGKLHIKKDRMLGDAFKNRGIKVWNLYRVSLNKSNKILLEGGFSKLDQH